MRSLAVRGGAVVVDEAVEEVAELVGGGAALVLVVDGGVGEREVDVAPRVLVRGRGKDPAGVEVKVLDLVLGHFGRARGAGVLVGAGGGRGEGRGGKESSSEAVHVEEL